LSYQSACNAQAGETPWEALFRRCVPRCFSGLRLARLGAATLRRSQTVGPDFVRPLASPKPSA